MKNCCTHHQPIHGTSPCMCPSLWSKAKKIRLLEEELEIMEDKTGEIKALIEELKSEQ